MGEVWKRKKYKHEDGSEGSHIYKLARSRDLTLYDVTRMTEEEAFWFLVEHRWRSRETIICSDCGSVNKHYYRKGRRQWRCKDCQAYFSLTTGTPLQDRKLPFTKILMALMEFIHDANGISHHELARKLDVQVKTAHVLIGKFRESLFNFRPKVQLSGTVHIDGGHFGGMPRHGRLRRKNDPKAVAEHVEARLQKRTDRKPRSKTALANWYRRKKNRRVIMVLRELYPELGIGARRTIVAVCMSENEVQATQLATAYVAPGTRIMTDENPAYNMLAVRYQHDTVLHALEFATEDGVSDNQAESYFSRLRRYVLGVSHRIEAKYMMDIAIEMAWRDDVRKITEGEKFKNLAKALFGSRRSSWWRGYWQGFNRPGELLWSAGTSA